MYLFAFRAIGTLLMALSFIWFFIPSRFGLDEIFIIWMGGFMGGLGAACIILARASTTFDKNQTDKENDEEEEI